MGANFGKAWQNRIKQSVVEVRLSKKIVEKHGNQNDIVRWGMKRGRDQDEEDGSKKEIVEQHENQNASALMDQSSKSVEHFN